MRRECLRLQECRAPACQQNCVDAYHKYYDVIGNCEGLDCICEFKKPCTIRYCYNKCMTKYQNETKVGLTGTCERTNCVCDWGNKCDKAKCKDSCVTLHGKGTKAKCVREDCVCRKK
ncbi:hypothetical protein V5799_018313 [Amblyomma americanum]|uniref:Uncharacterized protein n=1 Tax=Amblyomma americanum TaxID=6943 RepID=A0AAQ4EZT0_AMBAM